MNPNQHQDLVIQVRNLKKKYTLGQYDAARAGSAFKSKMQRLLGRPAQTPDQDEPSSGQWRDFWALKGIDLDVYRGETLGIIGINGSGKSTLLKLLSRITSPTEGEIGLCGVSASMLEIGTGFNGDMTGRENIYLNGTILGMSRAEISNKLDEIVEFSECADFIDTPVKRYSSGMYVRLAFSVSAFLDSDILMMDEVLAVGDTHFQKKCLEKMYSAAHSENRTVLFISHNMSSIQQLCTRCIVLNAGEKIFDGSVDEAIDLYTNLSNSHGLASLAASVRDEKSGLALIDASLAFTSNHTVVDDHIDLQVSMKAEGFERDVHFLIVFRDQANVSVGSFYTEQGYSFGGDQLFQDMFHIDVSQLMPGKYAADILVCHEVNGIVAPFSIFDNAVHFSRSQLGGAKRLDWNNHSWGNIRFPNMSQNHGAK